jgi:glycogen debranching enzyme
VINSQLTGEVTSVATAAGGVTLVEGRTFCLSAAGGDITPNQAQGLFVLDSRALSRWELRINGAPVEGLSVELNEPYSADFAGRARPLSGQSDADLVVFRRRRVGRGMSERIQLVNYSTAPIEATVEVLCDCDFAGIFEVKNGRVHDRPTRRAERDGAALRFYCEDDDGTLREVRVSVSEAAIIEPGLVTWRRTLADGERWELCCDVAVAFDGVALEPRFRCGIPEEETIPSRRLASWRAALPDVTSSCADLDAVVARSGEDLGSLRIFDPDHPDVPILAAGAPWYMTLFGRDSILTAWMTLLAEPALAVGVLDTLARFQGTDVDHRTDEEPGKILHEVRLDLGDGLSFAAGDIYYGSIDATPLFVMLLGEARRWGLDDDILARLLPHADRALDWIERFGDRDGDGYVEYQRATPDGLANQGWKDSWDGIRHADGRFPQPPIALCEVQAYVHAAYLARAHLAHDLGDHATRDHYRAKAAELRRRFNEDFWLDEQGWYALGLDADKRPVDALASNMAHCLWAEIIDPDRAELVARRLLSSEMFSGWGVRTLASSMAAYNPVSYHNGSVWPHDNAIAAAGLARYGFTAASHRIIRGQLEVASRCGGRLPELFAGFGRDEFGAPAAYPSSCSPQAWAAAAPLLWLRTLLALDPSTPDGELWVHPVLPEWLETLQVEGIIVGNRRISIHADDGDVEVTGTEGLVVVPKTRPPLWTGWGEQS